MFESCLWIHWMFLAPRWQGSELFRWFLQGNSNSPTIHRAVHQPAIFGAPKASLYLGMMSSEDGQGLSISKGRFLNLERKRTQNRWCNDVHVFPLHIHVFKFLIRWIAGSPPFPQASQMLAASTGMTLKRSWQFSTAYWANVQILQKRWPMRILKARTCPCVVVVEEEVVVTTTSSTTTTYY